MNTPTPETDAEIERIHSLWAHSVTIPREISDFARKLERERDEARREAEECRNEMGLKGKFPWEKGESPNNLWKTIGCTCSNPSKYIVGQNSNRCCGCDNIIPTP